MPKYKAIPDPTVDVNNLREVAASTKEVVEVLTRQRGDVYAAAVTWNDLVSLGLITKDKVPVR